MGRSLWSLEVRSRESRRSQEDIVKERKEKEVEGGKRREVKEWTAWLRLGPSLFKFGGGGKGEWLGFW